MMDRIRQELEKGGAVVLPTETVYGLFAKAPRRKKQLIMYTNSNVVLEIRPSILISPLSRDILHFSKNQPSYLQKLVETFCQAP